MAVTLATRLAVSVLAEQGLTGDLIPGGNGVTVAKLDAVNVLRNGTATGLADMIYADSARSIAASGTVSLDIATGGGLLDPQGRAIAMAKLKGIVVVASALNNVANNVEVTRPANGVPWAKTAGDAVPLAPGSIFTASWPGAGITVTAATGDLIDLVNSAGTNAVEFDIVVWGTSA